MGAHALLFVTESCMAVALHRTWHNLEKRCEISVWIMAGLYQTPCSNNILDDCTLVHRQTDTQRIRSTMSQ